MTGIDIVDTIVVRRAVEKGTKIISEPAKSMVWAGKSFKEHEKKRLAKAGTLNLLSKKGTQKILSTSLRETKVPNPSGRKLVSGRGTSIRICG